MSASLCNNIKAARTQFKICKSAYQGRQAGNEFETAKVAYRRQGKHKF